MTAPWVVVLHTLSKYAALVCPGLVWPQHALDERQEYVPSIVSSSVFGGGHFEVRYYQRLI